MRKRNNQPLLSDAQKLLLDDYTQWRNALQTAWSQEKYAEPEYAIAFALKVEAAKMGCGAAYRRCVEAGVMVPQI